MTAWQYILASLRQYRRVHLAVAAGVAVATAVITGALLVGDSMRGSLRDLALQGLGRIDAVLLSEHPFRTALSQELLDAPQVANIYDQAVPLLLTSGAATQQASDGEMRRATGLNVVGVPAEFWSLAPQKRPAPMTSGNEVALTSEVASELGAREGDFIVLRIPRQGATPADSALGEKEEAAASRRLKVTAVLNTADADGMARFSLRPAQQAPHNVFVPLATLQRMLKLEDDANAIAFAAANDGSLDRPVSPESLKIVEQTLRPQLSDYGLTVEDVAIGAAPDAAYVRISADRLVVPPHVVDVAEKQYATAGLQPVITYLANTIAAGDRKIPYSTVSGVDSTRGLGPVLDDGGEPIALADDEIALNDWAAEDLGVQIGDEITLTFYDPETTHGVLREHEPLRLKLKAIVPLADAEGRPTAAADPSFAPELPGVTDQDSIEDWELPFELVETVRDTDETYWHERRTTPKAFVSYDLAKRLWSTRWGVESVLRIPITTNIGAESGESGDDGNPSPSPSLQGRGIDAAGVAKLLSEKLQTAEMGMTLLPVKRQALAAAAGTTPFDGLFLGFSFFLMASAVMLTVLLFRLGIEQRVREVGLLLATGWSPRRVRATLLGEAAIVSTIGALVGALCGVAYAAVMVHGLNTWWVDATTEPFLRLHVTPRSIAIGFLAGLAVALTTIWWSLRRFSRLAARQMLAGDHQPPLAANRPAGWTRSILPLVCLVAAAALGLAAVRWEGEAQAGAFFGGGTLALIGILAAVRGRLLNAVNSPPTALTLVGLAARNARRNPSRTMMSLGLAATASFLIVALSAFRLAPTEGGTGGFALLATSDLPLYYDLNTPDGREQLGLSAADSEMFADSQFIGFRVRAGEDASCLNLYQTTQPRVLGAPPELGELGRFQWAMADKSDGDHPWDALLADLGSDANGRPIVPMVLDRNTAFYSLKLYALGDRLAIRDGLDREVTLQIVGMLANSILQGDVIISEANFLRLFPEVAGRNFYLIHRGPSAPSTSELSALLETELEDFGFDAVDARERLAALMAVQNTYLSTFQMLGGLGLLLGAVGLAVVQLRSVLERRGELALLQATGFRQSRLQEMVLTENLVLLLGGLAIGCGAALAAVLPHALLEQVGVPWRTLGALIAIVAIAGVAAGYLAARSALRAPLVPALRGD